jgi:peroxin-16
MFAKRRGGEKLRWRLVVMLECLKAICRIVMLRVTGMRMLVTPPLPERGPLPPDENDEAPDSPDKEWKMPRTGSPLPPLPPTNSIPAFLNTRVLSASDIKPPASLLRRLATPRAQFAEYLYILRPVIYALALQRFQHNKRDWKPWALGLAIEVGARQLQKREMQRQPWAVTSLEREEMARRRWGAGWWAMRGVFYEDVTRGWVSSVADRMRGRWGLDMVGAVVEDYAFLWDEYYFATASM